MMTWKESSFLFAVKRKRVVLSKSIVLTCLVVLCCGMTGCVVSSLKAKSDRPVHCEPVQAYVSSAAGSYRVGKMGVFPAVMPEYAANARDEVTSAYLGKLLESAAFARSTMLPHTVKSDEEAIWWGRRDNCDLVMRLTVLYLLDGSGAMPTKLQLGVRILDVRSSRPLWDLRQEAYSEPGPDIDFYWNTVSGSPAQKYGILAKALADQFSRFLRPPDENGGWCIKNFIKDN